ncbi:titin-like isoform X1 [Mizuhopecten yessoensis]|uniref:titin-like isoform X1 n=1 Tax=Mizuhopecten yessoensis TaxID=6573 RepID=UPI000B45832C|nr:titin-like isoform X1 [Mizuhopecten yessoensis]
METAKPTKFIRLLAKRLVSNGCVKDTHNLKPRRLLKEAVASLPEGTIKDTVNKRFGFYVKKLKLSIFEQHKRKVSAEPHKKDKFPYNLYTKKKHCVTGTIDDDQVQQTYGTLLCRKLEEDPVEKLVGLLAKIDEENQDSVLLNLTCGTTSYLGLLKTMHLYYLIVQPKSENTIRDYGETGNAEERKTDKNAMCRTLCDKVKHFLSVCHLRYSAIQKPEAPVYPYSYSDLLSTIMAVFFDLFLLSNRKSKKQEQASRRLCNLACYLTEDNPSYRLDVLIQMSKVHTDTALLLPYVRRSFEKKPDTGDFHHYLKYVLALRTVCDITDEKDESGEINTLKRQTSKTVPAPKHFLDWLEEINEDILDEMPVEDRRFKRSQVTKFILEEADDKLLSLLADTLTNGNEETEDQVSKKKKKATKKNKKTDEESKEMAEEDGTPDSELFFLDTGGNNEMTEQENLSDSELFFLDTGRSKKDRDTKMENQVLQKKVKASKTKKKEPKEAPATETEDQVVKKKKKKAKKEKKELKEDQVTKTEDQDTKTEDPVSKTEDPVSKKKKKKKKQKESKEAIELEERQDSQLFFLDTVGGKQKQDQDTKPEGQVPKKKDKSAKKKKKESKEATNIADENQETEVFFIDTGGSWHKQDDIDIEDKEESDDSITITDVTFVEQTVISSDNEEIMADEMDIRDMEEEEDEEEEEGEEEEKDMDVKNEDSDKENIEEKMTVKENLEETTIRPMDKDSEEKVMNLSEENGSDIEADTEEDVDVNTEDAEDIDEDQEENIEGFDSDDLVKPDETDDDESDEVIAESDAEDNDEVDSFEVKSDHGQTEEMLACFVNKSPRREDSDEMEVTLSTPDKIAESVPLPEIPVSGKSTRRRKAATNSRDTSDHSSGEQQMFTPTRKPSANTPRNRSPGKQSSVNTPRNRAPEKQSSVKTPRNRSPEKQSSVNTPRNRSPEKQSSVNTPRNRSAEKQSSVNTPRNRSPEKQSSVNAPRNRSPEKQSSVQTPRNRSPEKQSSVNTPRNRSTEKQSSVVKPKNTSPEKRSSAMTPRSISPKKRSSVATPTNIAPEKRLFEDVIGTSDDPDDYVFSPRKLGKTDVHQMIQGTTPEKKRKMRNGEVTEGASSETAPRKSRAATIKSPEKSQLKDGANSPGNSELKYEIFEFESDEEMIMKKIENRQNAESDRQKSPNTKSNRLNSPKTEPNRLKSPKTEDRLKTPKSMKEENKSTLSAKKLQTPRNQIQYKDEEEIASSSDKEEEISLHLRRSTRTPKKRQMEVSSSSKRIKTRTVTSNNVSSSMKQPEESVNNFDITDVLSGEIGNEVIPDSNDSENESPCEEDFPLLSSPVKESHQVPSSFNKTLHTKQTERTEVYIDTQSPAKSKKTLSKTPTEKFTSVKSLNLQPSPGIVDQPSPTKGQSNRRKARSSTSVVSNSVSNGVDSAVLALTTENLAAMASPGKRYSLRATRKRRESGTSDVSDLSLVTRSRKSVSGYVDSTLESSKKYSMTGNDESNSVSGSPDRTQGRSRLQTLDENSSNLMMVTDKNFIFSEKETQTPSSRRKSTSTTSVESPRKSERRRYSLRGKD